MHVNVVAICAFVVAGCRHLSHVCFHLNFLFSKNTVRQHQCQPKILAVNRSEACQCKFCIPLLTIEKSTILFVFYLLYVFCFLSIRNAAFTPHMLLLLNNNLLGCHTRWILNTFRYELLTMVILVSVLALLPSSIVFSVILVRWPK